MSLQELGRGVGGEVGPAALHLEQVGKMSPAELDNLSGDLTAIRDLRSTLSKFIPTPPERTDCVLLATGRFVHYARPEARSSFCGKSIAVVIAKVCKPVEVCQVCEQVAEVLR